MSMDVYATGMLWGESPRWHAGALWLSDTQGSRLWTSESGAWDHTDLASPCNGLWFLPDGRLIAAISGEQRLGVWNGRGFDTYADLGGATGPLGDVVGDRDGSLYVDDVGYVLGKQEPRPGQLLRIASDGAVSVAAPDIDFPNGLALIDGGRTLIVAETWTQRLLAFTVEPDGALTGRRLYADLARLVGPEARPDGIWPARGGGVWAACLTGHQVAHVNDEGLVRSLGTEDLLPIACCTDGGSRLFVTVADTRGRALADALAARQIWTEVVIFAA